MGKTTQINSFLPALVAEDVRVGIVGAQESGRQAPDRNPQGSEYPLVVILIMTQHYAMLARNLLTWG